MEEKAGAVEIQRSSSCSNHIQNYASMLLTKQLLKDKECNVVCSPLSLQIVLAMIAVGTEGQVLEQLLSILNAQSIDQLNSWASHIIHILTERLSSESDDPFLSFAKPHASPSHNHHHNPCLSLANGVWIDNSLSFNPFVKKVVEDLYKAASNVLDFKNQPSEAVDIVNTWVEEKTNGLIKNMLTPDVFDSQTKIVLANAIYFKASWAEQFEVFQTQKFDFHLLDNNNNHIRVPFMTSSDKYRFVGVFDGFKVLKLPYRNSQTAMHIFLPDAKDGLPTLIGKLGSEPAGFLERHIPHKSVRLGKFWIPKFKISFGFEASETLQEFGLRAPFVPGALDKMIESEKKNELLYVSAIFHKSTIEVNESGTEASAASVACIRFGASSCAPPPPTLIDFVADHPFLFTIREDKTGVVLFIGYVLNPLVT